MMSDLSVGGMIIRLGIAGVVIAAMLNVLALFYFESASGKVFSDGWWSSWFPLYLVFGVILLVGGALRLTGSSEG